MTENNYTPENGQLEQPQYQPPQYVEPQYQPPQYVEPQYQPPQYAEPQYQPPQYAEPQYQPPQYQYQQPQYQPPYQQAQPAGDASSQTGTMIMAIIGLALVAFFYTSIPGFILSIIAKNKVAAYATMGYPVVGQAKVAQILSKIGFIVGLILSIISTLVFMILLLG